MKKMRRLISLLLIMMTLCTVLPLSALASTRTMYVKTSNGLSLNVRSSMKTHTNNIITHLAYGKKVTVLRTYTNWCYISWGTKARGYVVRSCLSYTKPTTVSIRIRYIKGSGTYVPLRSSMQDHTLNVVCYMRTGSKVTLLESYTGGWYKVRYGSKTGYVQGKYLSRTK